MSYYLVNPGCFQGDPGNPPEYDTDDPMECHVCGEVFDADDLNNDGLCHDCAEALSDEEEDDEDLPL